MRRLLADAGFAILEQTDSSHASAEWFRQVATRVAASDQPPVAFRRFLGEDYLQMARNQVLNLAEGRIKTVSFICRS